MLRAVIVHGTVTKAAESLYRSPSGISRQLRELSAELGVELFEQEGRTLNPTPAAYLLLERSEQLFRLWEETQADLSAQSGELVGTVRVASFPTALAAVVAPVIADVQVAFPQLAVRAWEAEPAECFEFLTAGDIDLALVYITPETPESDDPRYASTTLYREPIDLLVREEDPLAARPKVALEDAADRPWIVGASYHSGSGHIVAACQAAGFTPRVVHHAHEWAAVASLVGQGLGVSIVSRMAKLDPAAGVVRVSLSGPVEPSRQVLGYTRAGAERNPAMLEVSSRISSCAEDVLKALENA